MRLLVCLKRHFNGALLVVFPPDSLHYFTERPLVNHVAELVLLGWIRSFKAIAQVADMTLELLPVAEDVALGERVDHDLEAHKGLRSLLILIELAHVGEQLLRKSLPLHWLVPRAHLLDDIDIFAWVCFVLQKEFSCRKLPHSEFTLEYRRCGVVFCIKPCLNTIQGLLHDGTLRVEMLKHGVPTLQLSKVVLRERHMLFDDDSRSRRSCEIHLC